jgi:hypothetical protein
MHLSKQDKVILNHTEPSPPRANYRKLYTKPLKQSLKLPDDLLKRLVEETSAK